MGNTSSKQDTLNRRDTGGVDEKQREYFLKLYEYEKSKAPERYTYVVVEAYLVVGTDPKKILHGHCSIHLRLWSDCYVRLDMTGHGKPSVKLLCPDTTGRAHECLVNKLRKTKNHENMQELMRSDFECGSWCRHKAGCQHESKSQPQNSSQTTVATLDSRRHGDQAVSKYLNVIFNLNEDPADKPEEKPLEKPRKDCWGWSFRMIDLFIVNRLLSGFDWDYKNANNEILKIRAESENGGICDLDCPSGAGVV
ncbi:hypothetical protein GE09DRAFT_1057675 [Coniochaeta sp. 2T2.1]|nr:hypothetical protein GE09DRAFT_1057675 [Coniochaeta sp. 2T2.1]